MPTPQANATLRAVHGAASSETWRSSSSSAGPEKWTGDVRCYFTEKRDKVLETADRRLVRWLIVANGDLPLDVLTDGDVVTFERDGRSAEETATIQTVERRELAGIPAPLQTSRVTFVPE